MNSVFQPTINILDLTQTSDVKLIKSALSRQFKFENLCWFPKILNPKWPAPVQKVICECFDLWTHNTLIRWKKKISWLLSSKLSVGLRIQSYFRTNKSNLFFCLNCGRVYSCSHTSKIVFTLHKNKCIRITRKRSIHSNFKMCRSDQYSNINSPLQRGPNVAVKLY